MSKAKAPCTMLGWKNNCKVLMCVQGSWDNNFLMSKAHDENYPGFRCTRAVEVCRIKRLLVTSSGVGVEHVELRMGKIGTMSRTLLARNFATQKCRGATLNSPRSATHNHVNKEGMIHEVRCRGREGKETEPKPTNMKKWETLEEEMGNTLKAVSS